MSLLLILFFGVLEMCALKTAALGLLSLLKMGDFFEEFRFEDVGSFFVVGDFGVEFVEGFSAGGKD